MERAASGGIAGGRDIAFEDNPLPFLCWIDCRDCGDEGLGIRVERSRVKLFMAGGLHDFPEIHDGHAVRNVLDDGKIMRNKNHCQVEFLSQIVQQIQNLRLDRHIQGRYRLVGDHQLRPNNERPGDGNPLALAAGKLMGEPPHVRRRETHAIEHFRHASMSFVGAEAFVDIQGFGQNVVDGHPGIQG